MFIILPVPLNHFVLDEVVEKLAVPRLDAFLGRKIVIHVCELWIQDLSIFFIEEAVVTIGVPRIIIHLVFIVWKGDTCSGVVLVFWISNLFYTFQTSVFLGEEEGPILKNGRCVVITWIKVVEILVGFQLVIRVVLTLQGTIGCPAAMVPQGTVSVQ